MEAEQIAAAVQKCVGEAAKSERPFRVVNEFLASLKQQGWEEPDRIAVQTQVLAAIKQQRLARSPSA